MNLKENAFLKGIKSGQPQIGLWVNLSNPYSTEMVAGSGYDWLLVDMEHSPNEIPIVMSQLQAIAAYGSTALVRPPVNDPVITKRLLDAGAPGLLFPMVQTVEEAQMAVAATRYPPHGIRGVAGSNRGNKFGRVKDYMQRADQETAVLIQAETVQALDNVVDLAVDGVDGVFFGPSDIAADMGLLGKPMDEAVWDKIKTAAKALIAKGVPVGTLVIQNTDFAKSLIDEGFSFVAVGSDSGLLVSGADQLLASMRS